MPMPRTPLAIALAALFSLTVAACSRDAGDTTAATPAAIETPAEATPVADPATPPGMPGECNADAVQSYIGQEATEETIEQARVDSGSATVRALKPGQPATMDFRPDRLDIALDKDNIIQTLRCG